MIVVINHQGFCEPSWKMEVNLANICNLVGAWVDKAAYPMKNVKKVLKLIFQECSQDEIENVQRYLNKHNKKCASEFQKICNKGR